jgi:hypothetical protein
MKKAIMLSAMLMSSSVLAEGLPPGHNELLSEPNKKPTVIGIEEQPQADKTLQMSSVKAAATCNLSLSGNALVEELLQAEKSCIDAVFSSNWITSQRYIDVANGAISRAANYTGISGDPLGHLF